MVDISAHAGAPGSHGAQLQTRVGLLGATGYAGRELIAILARHPKVRIVTLMSSGRLGAEAVYWSPELNTEAIRRARLVSNPGCYATSIILALAPLLRSGWVDVEAGIVCDAKSGASGAGRAPSDKLHFVEVNENCRAYSVF